MPKTWPPLGGRDCQSAPPGRAWEAFPHTYAERGHVFFTNNMGLKIGEPVSDKGLIKGPGAATVDSPNNST
jgi:hypothetical protein